MSLPVQGLELPELPPDEQVYAQDPAVDGGFRNPWGVRVDKGPSDLLRWQLERSPFRELKRRAPRLPSHPDPAAAWRALPPGARAQWLGHASVLVEIDGVVALIDPLFGRAALVPRAAPAPLRPAELPDIDVVLVTHGHYDHLDAGSIRALVARFGAELPVVVPAGLGRSLPSACRNITELSWWQSVAIRGVRISLTPAQHWHRRGPFDHDRALWGGYVLQGRRSLFHSGDTGWFGGFRTIGRVFPGLDLAVLPLGAYEPRWFMSGQHMAPEESLQALQDLGAAAMLGMHWGTFDLTDEPLDHGPFDLLPTALTDAGIDPGRVHVLAHGGALAFGDQPVVEGRAVDVDAADEDAAP